MESGLHWHSFLQKLGFLNYLKSRISNKLRRQCVREVGENICIATSISDAVFLKGHVGSTTAIAWFFGLSRF